MSHETGLEKLVCRWPRRLRLALVISLVWALGACGDEIVHVTPQGIDAPDATGTPGWPDDPNDPDAVSSTFDEATLVFVEAYGDDQVPCSNSTHCTVYLSFNETRSLAVRYEQDGVPVANKLVQFEAVNDDGGMAWLSGFATYTDADGLAQVETKSNVLQLGQYGVRAYVDNVDVNPLYFDVVVTPKSMVPLTVIGTYAGTQQIGAYTVRLYPQVDGAPDCADLDYLYEDAQALITSPATTFPQTVKFLELPGLEAAGTLDFAVLAYAENAQGAVAAWGCEPVQAEWGYSRTVGVELADRPPRYAGPYTVTSHFDFISALPANVQPWIYGILDIIENPTGGLLSLVCDLGGSVSVLDDLCEIVFNDPSDPDIDDLTILGGVIVDVLNAVIAGFAADSVWADVLNTGKDVSDILTDFEVHGTITLEDEPDADGVWTTDQTHETWDGMTVKWTLDANCDPLTDPDCGVTNIWFSAIQLNDPVQGQFSASVEDRWWLTIDPHPLNVKYGLMLNYIVQKVLLPLIAGDGSDGGPIVDSYAKLLGMLLGGKACLEPGATPCCESFAESIMDSGASIGVDVLEASCEALIDLGSSLIEDQLTGLDVETGDAFQISTKEPCRFEDVNGDLVIDSFGSEAEPCLWKVDLEFFGASTVMDGWFFAVKAN